MTGNYEKTLQKLELAEEKLKKASQKKKDLEAEKKTLLERAETERLSSRGMNTIEFFYTPSDLSLYAWNVNLYGEDHVLLSEISLYRDRELPWLLSQTPEKQPLLTAGYGTDGKLCKISIRHQTWDISSMLPALEGVEYLP